jgi:hypothetical protein
MSALRSTNQALRLLLAACALVAGLDLHVMEFTARTEAVELASGEPGLHGEGCSHREHVPPVHDPHHCVACKAGAAGAAGQLPGSTAHVEPAVRLTLAPAQAPRAPAAPLHGMLGARGPPGTTA